jgi:lactobin A/cerein 7B family class IIb bacteriocin
MKELTTEEMVEVQGGRSGLGVSGLGNVSEALGPGASAAAGSSSPNAITIGNVALAMNLDINVLSGNTGVSGLVASARAGTVA